MQPGEQSGGSRRDSQRRDDRSRYSRPRTSGSDQQDSRRQDEDNDGSENQEEDDDESSDEEDEDEEPSQAEIASLRGYNSLLARGYSPTQATATLIQSLQAQGLSYQAASRRALQLIRRSQESGQRR